MAGVGNHMYDDVERPIGCFGWRLPGKPRCILKKIDMRSDMRNDVCRRCVQGHMAMCAAA